MEQLKKVRIVPFKAKMIWLFVYCIILHMLLFNNTNSLIQNYVIGFIDYPKGSLSVDGTDFTPLANGFVSIIHSIASVFVIPVMFVMNLAVCVIATVVFRKLCFNTIADEKERYLVYLKMTLLFFPILGAILLMIFGLRIFPLSLILTCSHYLLFSVVSGISIWIKAKRFYSDLIDSGTK